MRVAILEDDPVQAHFAMDTLAGAGHVCHEFAKGDDLVRALRRQTFDLMLLDWQVSGASGEEVLRWARQSFVDHLPVIFITARGREDDVTSILNAGADDYIIKPISPGVLLARVTSLLRRTYKTNPGAPREIFGDFEFDIPLAQVLRKGIPLILTQREFNLALLLFQNLGRPLSRAHILELVWKQASDIPSRTMDTHISQVRSKLGLRPENGYRLAPIYGHGYRLEQIVMSEPVP
ncbi:response regulator transcription factor [Paraburkholderia bryophila]|uniref:response regulator transcription factor n=1 Tax=Paraburkholderia bryophila TaxID=420952 RepID=UPI00234AA608|nr:response regulator transcription factor [Paraburkholderia bryophila]WCM22571.1 response regulator transcription factor [Paraburkholderia bryophila]